MIKVLGAAQHVTVRMKTEPEAADLDLGGRLPLGRTLVAARSGHQLLVVGFGEVAHGGQEVGAVAREGQVRGGRAPTPRGRGHGHRGDDDLLDLVF